MNCPNCLLTQKLNINAICIDADNHKDDFKYLDALWRFVVAYKKRFSLAELSFIQEHITGYVKAIARNDAKELKTLLQL